MTTYEELNEQNHHITELSNVLRYLFKDRAMCDTHSCCDLFHNYMNLVEHHIDIVDREMYGDMLKDSDTKVNNVAKNFMSGSVEVKKILKNFSKQWCVNKHKKALQISSHNEFLADTEQLFDIVLQRILDETEHLYPMVRSLNRKQAA